MTTDFIHILEAITVFLVFVMLFQMWRHYYFFAQPKIETKPKQNRTTLRRATTPSPLVHNSVTPLHNARPTPNYYFPKLPELEVTVSSDQEIAAARQASRKHYTSSLKSDSTPHKSVIRKAAKRMNTPALNSERMPAPKAILNNYIDDFFSTPTPDIAEEVDIIPLLDLHIDSPANDEIITVNKQSEMV